MAKKKRKLVFTPREERPDRSRVECERCVYCGQRLSAEVPHDYAKVTVRSFAVCNEECRKGVEEYVLCDKKWKTALFITLGVAAAIILVAALFNMAGSILYVAFAIAGLGFIAFPYPVTSFETFQGCSIKTVTVITKAIGAVLILLAVVFQMMG